MVHYSKEKGLFCETSNYGPFASTLLHRLDLLRYRYCIKDFLNERCTGCPIRVLIAVLICFTAFANYTIITNMPLLITSMVIAKEPKPAECDKSVKNMTTLPDYGPRKEWDQAVQGNVLSSFFWGFVPFSILAGYITETVGPYKTILIVHALMALFNAGCPEAAKFSPYLLMLCRFLCGCAASLVYPSLQCMIARWAPPSEKGKFVSCLLGNNLGTWATWSFIGWLTEQMGWAAGFYAVSIFLVIFCLIFGFLASDSPATHRWIKEEELNYILEAQGGTVSTKKAMAPYLKMFTSVPFWALTCLHFGNLYGLYLQMQGANKYLNQVIGLTTAKTGTISSIPQIVRLFFGLAYGVIGDFLKKKYSTRCIRKTFVIFSHIIPGLLLMCLPLVKCEVIPIAVLLTLSQAINGAAVLTNLANPQDLAPNFAGTIFSILTLLCGTTGFIVPEITAIITKKTNGVYQWGIVFIIGGSMYIAGGVIFLIFGAAEVQSWNEKKED